MQSSDIDAETSYHPDLRVEFGAGLCTVTLDAPERRNAQTPSMWEAFEAIADRVEATPEIRVVLLRAEGPSFSAGLDRGMLTPGGMPGERDLVAACAESPSSGIADVQACQRGLARLRHMPAVVVAAVQGHAVGAGAELALSADLRLVSEDLALSWPEVPIGLVADLGGVARLTRVVGEPRALEIMLTGRVIGAEEAHTLGLVNRVVPLGDLEAAAQQVVTSLLDLPAEAMREKVLLVRGSTERTEADQLARDAAAQARLLHGIARRAQP
ncbi:MAG: enoyl-CoA hydratase/isomerase family protein [Dermatophilus congolensis]|nr:enoyl-CoA hydratase/isomerase family protein [Dermatophilus congolensis]